MHIINLIQCANLGGMEQASLRLMRGLMKRGHSCELISLHPLAGLKPLLADAGIPAEGLPHRGKGGWRDFPRLRRRMKCMQGDALIMTGQHVLGMLALGGNCPRRRILAVHFHHTGVRANWQWRLLYKAACERFGAITFPSDFIRREAEELYPPLAKQAFTIRNPLPLSEPSLPLQRTAARQALGLPLHCPVIGNGGWLIQRKRFDVFLRVAQRISQSIPDAHFVISGDGEEREKLQRLAGELGLQPRVRWLGWREDMETFYRSLDVCLFNSDWDAFPTTPLEAMSYGVPVVASLLHGGLQEVMTDIFSGLLLAEHDVNALASRVVHLLEEKQLALEIGLAMRSRVGALSAVPRIVEQHEELWDAA